jgi:uncharacterized membrane protein YkgB
MLQGDPMTPRRLQSWMTDHAVDALRVALGIVFIWFGALKVAGLSPAASLVTQVIGAKTVASVPVVPLLGIVEGVIGVGLVFGIALRTTLLLFVGQQAGTFLVLIVCPALAFQHHNPLLLTMTGEFVVKNVVLMAAGAAVAAAMVKRAPRPA